MGNHGFAGFMRRHDLLCFFGLTYGVSWLLWIPYVLSGNGLGIWSVHFPRILGDEELGGLLPGAYLGPLGSAFLITSMTEGRTGLRRWRARLTRWRVGCRWYALALAGVPAILVAGTLVLPGAVSGLRGTHVAAALFYSPLYLLMMLVQVLTTGVAEEPGWRDFALPRLQQRRGPLTGTLVLGVLWSGWHLPLFVTDWALRRNDLPTIAVFTVVGIELSILITWVFNHTRESLPVAVLIHTSNNNLLSVVWPEIFPDLDRSRDILLASAIGYGAVAIVVLLTTRGRLGYPSPHTADTMVRAHPPG
ncbi:CPBP family intramembrane glutamic endopeptidase [Nocardia arthritidis]|uniref:CPBP family intramembrane metalloprotease n=1 Tax=Nocardia arthritidis TaxID=228602 RepID=A0A6G9YD99_9NOCA|nr:type II CAAX endopeptidase family protein [Nocardia arthritidis]QIS11144.1 CPBP family intramembrane metalloprotease [Nocardia arthritidis]